MPISAPQLRSINGGPSISSIGQQRWLDQHQRQSQMMMKIGDRWPDTLATRTPSN
jgi:hypothetical protein